MKPIYLDNNATTPLDPAVMKRMADISASAFGNPGSRHAHGRAARLELEKARDEIAAILNADPREVIFTSGGTESLQLAIHGIAHARRQTSQKQTPLNPRNLILTTQGEHPATHAAMEQLERQGFEKQFLPVDENGLLQESGLTDLPWDRVALITVIYAHNETGVIQNLTRLTQAANAHQIPVHLDAVQAVGKIPVDFQKLEISAMSFGAHKFHGPRGIGGLILKEGVPIVPQLVGGFQERGRRGGTESVSLAAAMAQAMQLSVHSANDQDIALQRNRFEAELTKRCAPVTIHCVNVDRLPNTSNMAFDGIDGDALLVSLDLAGVSCSLGSACASGSTEPSPVFLAMGVSPQVAKSSLRFSFSRMTTAEETTEAIARIEKAVARLRG